MWPDRVSNPGPLTYESEALPTEIRGTAISTRLKVYKFLGRSHLFSYYRPMDALSLYNVQILSWSASNNTRYPIM